MKILKFFHEDFRDFLRILHQFLSVGIAMGSRGKRARGSVRGVSGGGRGAESEGLSQRGPGGPRWS